GDWSVTGVQTCALPISNYMIFDDQMPVNAARFQLQPTCQGTAGMVNAYTGYAQLFQRLIGYTPRFPFAATPTCWEHASKPYFTRAEGRRVGKERRQGAE